MPSASSAARTARAIATASGESPCTQRDAATTCTKVPVDGVDSTVADEADRARRDRFRGVEQGTRSAPGNEGAVRPVAAVEERLVHEGQARAERGTLDLAGQAQHGKGSAQPIGERGDRRDDRVGLRRVGADRVIQRAVRLDVADVGSARDECGELCGDAARELGRVDRDRDAAEVRPVGVGRVRADRDPEPLSAVDRLPHRGGIARVTAAGDARARDHREHRLVVGGRARRRRSRRGRR